MVNTAPPGTTTTLRTYVRSLRENMRPQRGRLLVLTELLIGQILLQVAGPQFLRLFIDGALNSFPTRVLLVLGGLYLVVAVLGQAISVIVQHLGAKVTWSVGARLRGQVVAHCLGLDSRFYQHNPPGELIDRIDGDVTGLATFLSRTVLDVLAQVVLVLCVLAALCALDWRLGLVYLPLCVASVPLMTRLVRRAMPHLSAGRQSGAKMLGLLEERLSAVEDIRANGAVPHVLREVRRTLRTRFATDRRAARAAVAFPLSVQALAQVCFAVALALGTWLRFSGALTTGAVFAMLSYVLLIRMPLSTITTQLGELGRGVVSLSRVDALLAERPSRPDGTGELPAEPLSTEPLSVEFDDVSFGYTARSRVLHHVSFHLAPGEHLGVVGRTGGGKSTLTRLLFGFDVPGEGTIRLGGLDAGDLSLASIRGRVALVTQEVQVLNATLRDNLTFFDDTIGDERLVAALAEVGLTEWYRSLPAGLDTVLGSGGTGLSAGQEQLVALVRAYLRNPGLVLLDEVSSRLDPHTEALSRQALARFLNGRTAIVIAHRLETLRDVDRVLVIGDGRVLEQGRRADLVADPGSELRRLMRSGDVLR